MKAKDVAKQYGLNNNYFLAWLRTSDVPHKVGAMGGVDIPDDQDMSQIVQRFQDEMALRQETAEQQAAEQRRMEEERLQALSNIIITSGFTFDGYTITKYSGYISGDHAIQVARGSQGFFSDNTTDVGQALMSSLVKLRREALTELKETALALGCNAIIGVDFDYITLEPENMTREGTIKHLPYVFGVTANGNAVVIEPNRRQGLSE